jgi:TonB-linked SusC/RagA family outer membrane protein
MKKITLLLAFFAIGLNVLVAQTREITGKVTSADDGGSMPGVSISVKGTSLGTITDTDGKYVLKVPADAKTLVFSFVGMALQEIAIGTQSVINVQLKSEDIAVDEVVVVGYGVQKKRDISGSVSTVKGETIKNIPVQTFEQALQGKAAGVQLTIPNGLLGNPPVVRIRGFNSISGSSNPLYIVDGVPVFTGDVSRTSASLNALGDINPSDIASIEVLKDASATAIYGSRAANGVVLITTKKGSSGKLTVTYDANVGWTSPYRLYELMNAKEFVDTKNTARANANGLAPAYFIQKNAAGQEIDTDWNDYVYQTGFQQNHNMSFSGGTSATTYYLGLGYSDNEGILITNTFKRKNVRFNLDHKLNKWITLGASINYTNSFSNSPNSGSVYGANFSTAGSGRLAFVTSPTVPAFLDNGDYNIDWANNRVGLGTNTQPVGFFHPVFLQDKNYNNSQSDRLISNLYINLQLYKDLYFRSVYGIDNSIVESKTFWHPDHGDGKTNGGEAYNYMDRRDRWNWTNTLNYATTIDEKLTLKALVGSEEQYSNFDGWSGRRTGLADVFFTDYQGSFTTAQHPPTAMLYENYFNSFFGRLNADWQKKYYVELSARRDGFSGLAKGNKYGDFGGASVMWNISNEGFIKNSSISKYISDLRIKSSYGRVGNISGVGSYASLFLYAAGVYNNSGTLYFNQAGNSDLQWETSNKFDLGLSFAILKDRMQFELNYFDNDVNGLILNVPQSPSKGIPGNTLPMNVGSMKNQGVEFSMTSYNINKNKFKWNTNFNFTYLKNEVTSLADGVPFLAGVTQLETTSRTLVGYPIGMIWGVKTTGVDPETGRRGFIRKNIVNGKWDGTTTTVYYNHQANVPTSGWRDANGNVSRSVDISNDGYALGSPIPKFTGGLDNNFIYGNFDFNLSLTYAFGFYVYNGSKAGLRDQRNWNNTKEVAQTYWKKPGDITDIPRPVWGDNISNGSSMVQSQNVEHGDFVKVRNISLGYTLKNNILKKAEISSLRIYSQIFNAYTFTNYTGADPEISSNGDYNLAPGIDRNTIPQARTISFGVNVTF